MTAKHYCSFLLLNSRFWFYLLFVHLLLASHTPAPGARAYDRHSSWLAEGSKQQGSLPPSLIVCFKIHSVRGASSRQGTTTNTPDSFPVSHESAPFSSKPILQILKHSIYLLLLLPYSCKL